MESSVARSAVRRSEKNLLEKFLSLFTEVGPGEGLSALLLMLNVLMLLAAYYIIKPVREALILSEPSGPEVKSYLSAVMAVLLVLLVPAYAKLVNRFIRSRLIAVVTLFFMACLVGFWGMDKLGVPRLGYPFFVWVGIFNLMVINQFWSFANDVYSSEAGKRLFPLIAFGASSGAVVGPWVTELLLEVMSTFELLLVCASVLGACILITQWVAGREFGAEAPDSSGPIEERKADKSPERFFDSFELLFRHRYLGAIAVLVLLLNFVNTTGEYVLGSVVSQDAKARAAQMVEETRSEGARLAMESEIGAPTDEELQKEYQSKIIGRFYSKFFWWVNLIGALFQLFLVSRLVKIGGMYGALIMLPIIAFGTYAIVVAAPLLAYVRIGKILENATDYSVNNTARHMLLLPTSTEIKYKAKQAIDTFMQRAGDLFSGLLVLVCVQNLGMGIGQIALVNLVVIIGWVFLAWRIAGKFHCIEAGDCPEIAGELN